MIRSPHSFYVTGGNVPADSLSYVPRQADIILCEQLLQGDFCYVLTSRQMGKSSLMVQTVRRLREQKVVSVVLDLTRQGSNLSEGQWYTGLLEELGHRLNRADSLEAFCRENKHLSPLQRWQKALRDIVLKEISGRVVIFIDEIEVVRSLSFSTDEFFAAIRSCYNERTIDSQYQRLAFCLLGVASPPDLIRDPARTPFNIGTRIDLDDFTREEAELLQHGLGRDPELCRLLMKRVYHWTAGQPYLTQRLCKAISEDETALNESDVDRKCSQIFLAPATGLHDSNLMYVRQRLLPEDEAMRSALLSLYRRIIDGKRVRDNEANELISILKLSGVVRAERGMMRVRNRIYSYMFDRKWINEHMPGAEKRRQKTAYWRGALAFSGVGAMLLLLIAASVAAWFFQHTARIKSELLQKVEAASKRITETNEKLTLSVYAGDMLRVNRYCDINNLQRADTLLTEQRSSRGAADLPFEWRYFWQECHRDQRTIVAHKDIILTFALSPDGKTLFTGSQDSTVKLWEVSTGKLLRRMAERFDAIFRLALSPDGKTLAVSCEDGNIWVIDLISDKRYSFSIPNEKQNFLAFAPDGRTLFTAGVKGRIERRDLKNHTSSLPAFPGISAGIESLAVSSDGGTIAVGGKALVLCDTATGKVRASTPAARLFHQSWSVTSPVFTPDGTTLAVGGVNGEVALLNAETLRILRRLPGHKANIHAMAFSRDGRMLATAGWDFTAHLYDLAAKTVTEVKGHQSLVNCVAFTPDSKTLLTAGNDATVKFWEINTLRHSDVIKAHANPISSLSFAANSEILYSFSSPSTGSFGNPRQWNVADGRQFGALPVHATAQLIACSPDGNWLATLNETTGTVILWNAVTHREFSRFTVKPYSHCLAFSPDSRLLAADDLDSNKNGVIRLWNISARHVDHVLSVGVGYVTFLAFSPDNARLASATVSDPIHSLIICDLATGRRTAMRTEHHNVILAGAFAPDGNTFASASWDSRLIFWNAKTWQPFEPIAAHNGNIAAMSFSSDSNTLATGAVDRLIKLWNVETRKEVAILTRHHSGITCVRFSPDGNTLATGDNDGKIILWRAVSSKAIATRKEEGR